MHADWTVNYNALDKNFKHQLLLLTMVDTATWWSKFGPLLNHTTEAASKWLNKYWFSHIPWSRKVIYDNGSESLGYNFQELLESYGIKRLTAMVKNIQALQY